MFRMDMTAKAERLAPIRKLEAQMTLTIDEALT
jgi:hypothetical protein